MDNKQKEKGLLLINLGTPANLYIDDVKLFLTEFLMDKYVMDFPYLFRLLLVRGVIIPARGYRSLAAYRKIWMKEGSPLMVFSKLLQEKVQSRTTIPVALSMRYGKPSIEEAFGELLRCNPSLSEVIVLPLYPHYTMSSLGTAIGAVRWVYKKGQYPFKIRFLNAFYNNPEYIASLAQSITPYLNRDYDKLLFSYHSIPERHLAKDEQVRRESKNSDYLIPAIDYRQQAMETAQLVAEYLQIPATKYEVSFQSRLTAAGVKWLQPYTVNRLSDLPREGAKKILIVCPAFVSDCLETLEEVGIEGKKTFLQSGGTECTLIPCINDQGSFVTAILKWIGEY